MAAEPEALAAACARLVEERKAEDIVVLQVAPLTSIADYFVIATGRNVRQLRAMATEIQEGLDRLRIRPLGVEGSSESGWILVDLGAVVVHLFDPATRRLYDLEMLWGDAPLVEWEQVLPIEGAKQREGA